MLVRCLAVADGGVVFCGTWAFPYARVTPSCDSIPSAWNAVGVVLEPIDVCPQDPASAQHVRFVADDGTYDSTDGGVSWVARGRPDDRVAIETFPRNSQVRFAAESIAAAISFDPQLSVRVVTRDGGRSWVAPLGLPPVSASRLVGEPELDPDGRGAWAFTREHAYRSTDGGAHFVVAGNGLSDATDYLAIQSRPDPRVLVWATATFTKRERAIVSFDTRTHAWSRERLPLAPEDPLEEVVTAATFVPGSRGALCLGIQKSPPPAIALPL